MNRVQLELYVNGKIKYIFTVFISFLIHKN